MRSYRKKASMIQNTKYSNMKAIFTKYSNMKGIFTFFHLMK